MPSVPTPSRICCPRVRSGFLITLSSLAEATAGRLKRKTCIRGDELCTYLTYPLAGFAARASHESCRLPEEASVMQPPLQLTFRSTSQSIFASPGGEIAVNRAPSEPQVSRNAYESADLEKVPT